MIYHDLDELNKVIVSLNNYCSDMGFNITVTPSNNYFNYRITDENSKEFYVSSGLIYKYTKHNSKYLGMFDENILEGNRIEFNYMKDKSYKYGHILTRNDYVCNECKESKNLYVCKTFDFLDVFCLHSDYIKDEIMCLVDE